MQDPSQREPTRTEDTKNLSVVIGAALLTTVVTAGLLASVVSHPPAPAPVVFEAAPTPPPAPVVEVVEAVKVVKPVQVVRASGNNRLYGTVVTDWGEEFTGYIRWDKNEGSWADHLDATKPSQTIASAGSDDDSWSYEDDRGRSRRRGRDSSITINGRRIIISGRGSRGIVTGSSQSAIRFGHVARIDVTGRNSAMFTLKSGDQVELQGNATDLGSGLRALIIEDATQGMVKLEWDDLRSVDFMAADESQQPESARLYGTMVTRSGLEFTGYVAWDVDEIYALDVLDGEDRGMDREIEFGDIELIERHSSDGARVTLKNGDEMVLRGTNDVNDSNSGISISDPALGQVKVSWDQFESLRFHEAQTHAGYDQFDGGSQIQGTVVTLDGEELSGRIVWDCDEAFTWEMLNGDYAGVDFQVEFSNIASITRESRRGAVVELHDGRTFELSGSNDVNSGNRGIYIYDADGSKREIHWEDLGSAHFPQR